MAGRTISIGELARRAQVGVETVRYYERKGLLREPPRSESGYRQYASVSVRRLLFIRRAKAVGFSLREIQELLDRRAGGRNPCAEVRQHLQAKIADLDRRMLSLREMRQQLVAWVESCDSEVSPAECPVLAELDGDGR